ncbi:hypothetical protein F441_15306 [Phytophthora nicotianae CJ01A1]|uniref:Uncharacterized protein n=2 Tax=Phytophthora nicotianae TaxID=4792 RepID=W2WEJ9_PHYNI|nr:hypothetical protein L916_14940 [Phytophthora nicotianae]ETP08777.1 hypothetical protein F441_15306 [Phytophthora nicotianae CJ01A1]
MTLSSLNTWDFFSPHANTVLVSMQTAVLAGNQQQNDAIGSLLHDSQLELGLETEAPRQQQQFDAASQSLNTAEPTDNAPPMTDP